MKIKTIRNRLDNAEDFDRDVNAAIEEGYILKKRYLSSTPRDGAYRMLIAELEKDPEPYRRPLVFDVTLEMDEAKKQIEEIISGEVEIPIKYFSDAIEHIQKIDVGDWIDLRAAENVVLRSGEYKLIRLGVGMILPEGYEAHVVPRSSTFKNFGIIQANSFGVIDNSYSGDADEWHFPAIALRDTSIRIGDRICQFRIMRKQPPIDFLTVDRLNTESRGGIGSTGTR